MKGFVRAVILIGVLLAPAAGMARSSVPIVERPDVPVVTGSGKPVSAEGLNRAIISGGAAGKRKWDVVPAADGKSLRATYQVRAHAITVSIVPEASSYSVKYADSVNMNYAVEDGKPVIHPNYNQWVEQLIDSIRAELRKL